jgi:hypothetical protein
MLLVDAQLARILDESRDGGVWRELFEVERRGRAFWLPAAAQPPPSHPLNTSSDLFLLCLDSLPEALEDCIWVLS